MIGRVDNMNKNRGLIIAAVLLLLYGTGMFVFAGSSEEDYSTKGNGQNTKYTDESKNEGKTNTTQNTNNQKEENTNEELESVNNVENTNGNIENTVNTKPNNTGNIENNNENNSSGNQNNNGESTNPPENNNPDTSKPDSGNTEDNNGGNGTNDKEENEENKPQEPEEDGFQFINDTSFNTEKIIIKEPGYGRMEIFEWPDLDINKKITIYENVFTVTSNTTYMFFVYDKEGKLINKAKMTYDGIAPVITGVATTSKGTTDIIQKDVVYNSVTLTFTDNDMSEITIKNGEKEEKREFDKKDKNRKKYVETFTISGKYLVTVRDRAGNESTIEFSIK